MPSWCTYDCLRRHWLASPQCSLTLPSNPVLNDSFGLYSTDLYTIYYFPPLFLCCFCLIQPFCFTHMNDNFPLFLGPWGSIPFPLVGPNL